MPKYRVPVTISTIVEVEAPNGISAEDVANEMAAKSFPQAETHITVDTPSVKSAYEVSVTFYLDAFTHEEVEDRICEIVRKGTVHEIANGNGIGFDIEAIKQGGPCRG